MLQTITSQSRPNVLTTDGPLKLIGSVFADFINFCVCPGDCCPVGLVDFAYTANDVSVEPRLINEICQNCGQRRNQTIGLSLIGGKVITPLVDNLTCFLSLK